MNTTKKGDKLEDQVFEVFESQIADDCFIAKREFCKIFRKKGYYSKDREKEIIFDVSVEVTLPGQKRYSLLFLIECKNYSHSVPVDDAEEFFSKIQQISGANTKGIIVSTNSFQDGAFKFSRSKGIGLLRYFRKDKLEWILARSPSSMASSSIVSSEWSNSYHALHDEGFSSRYFDFYGCVNDAYTVSLNHFFSSLARTGAHPDFLKALAIVEQSTKKSRLCVPYLEREEVESRAADILSDIEYVSGVVSIDSICDFLAVNSALDVNTKTNLPKGVLGQIAFGPDIISIDNDQASSNEQARFTLAHELGHYLLGHGKFMARESCREEDIAINDIDAIKLKDIHRLEWQANYFASCLLLPKEQFEKEVLSQVQRYGLFNRGFGLLYLDDQLCNIDTFHKLSTPLMKMFQVSRTVVKIRLMKLGFLNEAQ